MFVSGSDMEQASAAFATGAALFSHVCRIGDGICREDTNLSEEIVKRSYKVLLFAASLFDYAAELTKKCTPAGSKDTSDMLCSGAGVTLSAVFKDLCVAQAQEITLRQGAAGRTNPKLLSEISSDSHSKYNALSKTLKSLPVSQRHKSGKQVPSLLNQLRAFAEWKAQYYKAVCLFYLGLVEWGKGDAEGCGKSIHAFKQSIAAFESLEKESSSLGDYTLFYRKEKSERSAANWLERL
jgi:hypothetical protein